MHLFQGRSGPASAPQAPATLLVGNPNVGKSVLFGILTGRYANVSNYPGTTVEITRGRYRHGPGSVLDLPGTNSLIPNSEDEQVTRDVLLDHLAEGRGRVIQVCDAKNLRRGVALALQLAELGVPTVFVANMLDEAQARGYEFDGAALARELELEVVEVVATKRKGTADLAGDAVGFRRSPRRVRYEAPIEQAIQAVEGMLPPPLAGKRGLALMLLAGEHTLLQRARHLLGERLADLEPLQAELARRFPQSLRVAIDRARLAEADRIVARVLRRTGALRSVWLARLGEAAIHPGWGIPVAAAVLYLIYLFVGVFGAGTAVDFLETTVFGEGTMGWLDRGLRLVLPEPVEAFLVGPAGAAAATGPGLLIGDYGLISMGLSYAFAIVMPIVGFFFIAFSILEDSGYLPRLAVVLNRAFRLIGLNGKAVLPMILGLGCDTMATMTTRILATRKERMLVTLLLALGVPCSAQLGVILGMLAALSPMALLWWLGTVMGVMLLVGYLANKVLPGAGGDFVLEIPPMRMPVLSNVLIKTIARIEWYLKEVVPLFLLGTFLLWLLHRLDALTAIERGFAPLTQTLLGLPARSAEAFLIGFLRRDYGAAGLYNLFRESLAGGAIPVETEIQVVVALVTITLFMPCIANFFMIVKERGLATALWMSAFIVPFAFLVGGALNLLLRGILL
jgi:ferrous iron transport protein B